MSRRKPEPVPPQSVIAQRGNPVHRYLDELLSYGGEPCTRGEVIADMQRSGTPQGLIDRWLQGQENAARREAERNHLAVRVRVSATK